MTASALEPLVCVVDDDVSVRESVEGLFREEGFHVDMFESAEGFLGRARTDPPACLVVDLMLPGMSGLELHEELARRGLDAPTILLTGHGDVATSVRAMKAGAIDFLTKPYDPDDLLAAVRQVVSRRFPEKTEGTPRRIDGMVGESEVLRRVLNEVDLVAETDATVLVTGESGTGKELVARAIHDRSRRRQGPMVRVNCAAIPETLFESELFGHVRGAFTGAQNDRPGRFEAAQGGTLFLDEIGEVPLAMQPKLLRVLQEKEFERVGETRPRKVDVRIVAATNRNLAEEVEAGRFRADLFYRLNVFPIDNPPLRDRREDIPLLADHFIEASARRLRRPPPRLSEVGLRQLMNRDWPGNIRELENVIERATILARDGQLRFDLPPVGPPRPLSTSGGLPLLSRAAIEKHQRDAIVAALERSGGRVSGPGAAAELLGMKPSTLYSRMSALGLRRNQKQLRVRALAWPIGLALILLAPAGRGAADDLERDVSPAASTPWRAPDLGGYSKALRSAEAAPIDPQKRYELPELIDLAERLNPETRVAWEHARQAAIAVGLVQSEYSPILSLNALGGYHSEAFPAPKDVAPSGFFRADLEQARPTLNLEWLLLDFGRRGSRLDAAKQRLLAANLGFNRKHQEIVYRVRRAFVAMTSLTAKIAVAQSAVDSARAVREAAESRLQNGLATRPEVALARQQEAQAAFDLEDVLARERDAQVRLADSIGLPPTTPIQLGEVSALPAPAALEQSVEKVIDLSFEQRPDLIARVAALRAKEADVRRARAAYYPTLALVGDVGFMTGRAKITGGNQPTGWFGASEPGYGVGLALHWNLFEGGATRRRVELAEAERRAAESEVTEARDRAVSEVWTAYTDVKLAVRRLDTAAALVEASQQSYEATLGSYRQGLETLTNLLVARRELSHARFVELDTRLQLFDASAALAFSTGEAPPRAVGAAAAR